MRATAAAVENPGWSFPRERQATREAILAAAHGLAEREGLEAVTLSAVARETKIARAVIYSHFTRRQDLLAALENPATNTPAEEVSIEAETPPVVADEAEATAAEPPQIQEAAGEQPEAVDTATPETGGYDEVIQTQVDALKQITSQVPKAKRETEAALSGLDARMAKTEQSFAALERKVDGQLKSLAGQTGSLAQTVTGLRSRLEKFELRQQTALAELRRDIHSLVRPGEPLPPPAELQPELPFEPTPEEDVEIELVIEDPPAVETEAVAVAEEVQKPGYLRSARMAAINAARKQEMPRRRRFRPKSELMRRMWRNRWAIVVAVTVVVVAFDSWVFANTQPVPGSVVPAATVPVAKTRHILTPHAQLVRGLKYLNGTGVAVNVGKARALLERAAVRGEPVAQNLMGVLYQTGTGVPVDINTAIRWYESSAQHGNLKAMTNLGKLYAGGWKEGTDYVKAAEWFSKAASYGDVDAQFDLAILYERGEGVSRNLSDAYKWYLIASRSGDSHAADRAGALASQLDAEDLQAADAAVAMFKPIAVDRAANDVPQTNS